MSHSPLAQGYWSHAEELYTLASEASEEEEMSITGLRVLEWQQQVAADVMLGAAQLAIAERDWTRAEQMLTKVWSCDPVRPYVNSPLIPPDQIVMWQQQLAVDVMLGAAQTAAAEQAWTKAEELLSKVWSCDPF